MKATDEKFEQLKEALRQMGRVAVAFSGGVDSSFLLSCAVQTLGREKVTAVTVVSELIPEKELSEARAFCAERGIRQILCPVSALEIEGLRDNPPDRCYLCKKEIFTQICRIAEEEGIRFVAEGSNADDAGDYRPGIRALAELGIRSPMKEAGLSKQEIRQLSKEMGLPVWNKPSAACLASRIAYGEPVTKERLSMVEQAEVLLSSMGFGQLRVRVHGHGAGTMARIEVESADIARIVQPEMRRPIAEALKKLGFTYVTLDLEGFRSGSMNQTIDG